MKPKKLNVLKAFCSLTGAKIERKITLASLRKDTSKWSEVGELRIFNLPTRVTLKKCDASTCYYDNFVDPSEFSSQELEHIGDLDVPDDDKYGRIEWRGMKVVSLYFIILLKF